MRRAAAELIEGGASDREVAKQFRVSGPATQGWDKDQCWTLARIAELARERFRVQYTLAHGRAAAPDRVERAGPGAAGRRAG